LKSGKKESTGKMDFTGQQQGGSFGKKFWKKKIAFGNGVISHVRKDRKGREKIRLPAASPAPAG